MHKKYGHVVNNDNMGKMSRTKPQGRIKYNVCRPTQDLLIFTKSQSYLIYEILILIFCWCLPTPRYCRPPPLHPA